MGKVASDKCHKWVLKETSECEPNISNYWQSSFDALPSEWTEQFNSGIQTIAVIQAGHGLLQLGSCEIIPEDLHFVLRMRHTFESLGFQPGFYLSQLFSSNRDLSSFSSSSSLNVTKHPSVCRPPPIFNWSQRSIPCATNFQNNANIAFPPKDGIQLCHLPHSNETLIENMVAEHDSDIKWPSGLSFFTALTGRSEDAKLLLGEEGLSKQSIEHNPFVSTSKMLMNFSSDPNLSRAISESSNTEMRNPNEYLSLESHHSNDRSTENRFKRSFTSPARMASSSSSSSMDHHSQQQPVNYRSSEARIYPDIMENFLN